MLPLDLCNRSACEHTPGHMCENLDERNLPELEKGPLDYPGINLHSVPNEKTKPLGC